MLLRAGALPADLTIVEERTVGPSLGQDSIRAGAIAAIVGLVAVVVFMIASYGLLGFFADLAMIANTFLMFGFITVDRRDADAARHCRHRADHGHGGRRQRADLRAHARGVRISAAPPSRAIEAGFSRAFATIIDSHLTALIAALALFALGSGPIRGFAVAFAIGIISTLFTAYLMTRLIVATWVRRTRPKTRAALGSDPCRLSHRPRRHQHPVHAAGEHPHADLARPRSSLSFVLLFTVGLNEGIDFKGGTHDRGAEQSGPADLAGDPLRGLARSISATSRCRGSAQPTDVLIRVAMQPGGDAAQQAAWRRCRATLGSDDYEYRRVEVVGPRVSGELAWTGADGDCCSPSSAS